MRYITFNGISNTYFGLTISGNTPLLIPKPKNSSIEVPYANGTVDTSEISGQLYFQDSTIQYEMIYTVPNVRNGMVLSTEELNQIMTDKIEDVTDWLYSGPATLTDTGLNNSLSNADCDGLSINKSIAAGHWALKFTISFKADYVSTNVYPTYCVPTRRGRFIVYNGRTSYDTGLEMISMTPVTVVNGKNKTVDIANMDGTLNITHGRNGLSSGKDSMFFKDISISYKFIKTFKKEYTSQGQKHQYTQDQMCQQLQEYVDAICNWLYKHPNASFITIDGYVSYGGTEMMLMDSAWIAGTIPDYGYCTCRYLPSARVTGLDIEKSIFSDCWALTFDVTFTAYPQYFTGNLYLPRITDLQPPVITISTWKHYMEVDTNTQYDSALMVEYDSNDNFLMGPGIFLSHDNIDTTTEFVKVDSSDFVSQSFYYSNGTLYFKLNFSVPSYVHDSISSLTDKYVLMIELPPYIELTIDNRTMRYILYFNDITANASKKVEREFSFYPAGSDPYDTSFSGVVFVDEFSGTFTFYALPVNEDGIIAGPNLFTDEQISEAYSTLRVPITIHYVKRIHGNDVLADYGLWGDHTENTPEQYYIFKSAIMNYTQTEMDDWNKDTIIPYNFAGSSDTVKFHHPSAYYGTNVAVALNVPIESGAGNNYIFCDSKKPDGGDIQCL